MKNETIYTDIRNAGDDDKYSHLNSLAEVIGHFYKGKKVQVFWGDTGGGGNVNYSEYSVSNNLYAEGVVLWGRGEVFVLECEVETSSNKFTTPVVFNAYNVYLVSPIDGVDIMHCLKGRLKSKGKVEK